MKKLFTKEFNRELSLRLVQVRETLKITLGDAYSQAVEQPIYMLRFVMRMLRISPVHAYIKVVTIPDLEKGTIALYSAALIEIVEKDKGGA